MPKRSRSHENARRWQLQAENDLAYAHVGLHAGFAAQTCFMAQQVAEKSIKALRYALGQIDIRGHSCAKLAAAVGEDLPALSAMADMLLQLDQYYVPARYPNGIPSGAPFEAYSLQQARDALEIAGQVTAIVRAALDDVASGWENAAE